jgi:hypothetical protein
MSKAANSSSYVEIREIARQLIRSHWVSLRNRETTGDKIEVTRLSPSKVSFSRYGTTGVTVINSVGSQ